MVSPRLPYTLAGYVSKSFCQTLAGRQYKTDVLSLLSDLNQRRFTADTVYILSLFTITTTREGMATPTLKNESKLKQSNCYVKNFGGKWQKTTWQKFIDWTIHQTICFMCFWNVCILHLPYLLCRSLGKFLRNAPTLSPQLIRNWMGSGKETRTKQRIITREGNCDQILGLEVYGIAQLNWVGTF